MIYKSAEEIYALVRSFEDRSLSKSEWTHTAHLTVGLFYCTRLPFGVAKNVIRDGIYWLNDVHGTPNTESSGYHETLTIFWLKRIWNYIDENPHVTDIAALVNGLIDANNDSNLPLKYYSRGLLFSTCARAEYVRPDLPAGPQRGFATTLLKLTPL